MFELLKAISLELICGLIGILVPVLAGFIGFEARSSVCTWSAVDKVQKRSGNTDDQ
jgi:hypothetical protein